MKTIANYQNGNTHVELFDDGTLIRTIPDNEKVVVDFPSSMDIKITNWCDAGCSFCHEKSTTSGQHGDLEKLKSVLNDLPPGTEIACLTGDTVVYNENGAIEIKDISIGDKIYDSNHELKTITNIVKSYKKTIKINCSKGIKLSSSEDHPFMVDNTQVKAIDLINKNIDTISCVNQPVNIPKYKIDLAKYVTKPNKVGKGGSVGGKILANKVRLNHSGGWCDRSISLDEDIMWLYGLIIAEGSSRHISLNISETDISGRVSNIYKKVFNRNVSIYVNKDRKVMQLYPNDPFIFKSMFFEAMNIGYGAKNKSCGFLFSINDKELIRSALLGMFQGDGAFRKRKTKGNFHFSLTYKTVSKKLAYEIIFLLKKWFDITASIHYGISPERQIEGRTLKSSDYYKIDIYGKKNIDILFPEYWKNDPDYISCGSKKYSNSKINTEVNVKSITNLEDDYVYDITLDNSSTHIFPINGYVLTHNCGGGNPLSHPNIYDFLVWVKQKGIITNITINQKHVKSDFNLIKKLIEEDLVKGVGISYTSSSYLPDIAEVMKLTDNLVFHIIMGVNKLDDINQLMNFCDKQNKKCKILVLGYKEYGFGLNYYLKNKKIEDVKYSWYTGLANFFNKDLVLSFDNLALKQLDLKRFFTEESWNSFFMGDDGVYTMYIDAVSQTFAKSSTSNNRKSFDDIKLLDFFKQLSEENNV